MTATATKLAHDFNERLERIEIELKRMNDTNVDLGQMVANVNYIFSPDGPWFEIRKKVSDHDTFVQQAKGAIGLVAAISLASAWGWLKGQFKG